MLSTCFCAELMHSGHWIIWLHQAPRPALPAPGSLVGVRLIDKTLAIFLEDILYLLERKFNTLFSVQI